MSATCGTNGIGIRTPGGNGFIGRCYRCAGSTGGKAVAAIAKGIDRTGLACDQPRTGIHIQPRLRCSQGRNAGRVTEA